MLKSVQTICIPQCFRNLDQHRRTKNWWSFLTCICPVFAWKWSFNARKIFYAGFLNEFDNFIQIIRSISINSFITEVPIIQKPVHYIIGTSVKFKDHSIHTLLGSFALINLEPYSEPEPYQTIKKELFAKIVTIFQPLTIFSKSSILDVSEGPEYASGICCCYRLWFSSNILLLVDPSY